MTAKLCSNTLSRGAVGEWDVVVRNVVEEMDLFLLEHETCGNRVHWSITPSLVKETTVLVQSIKVINVRLRAQPVQATNLKVGPLLSISILDLR